MPYNTAEIDRFSKHAHTWWDENGPYAILHKIAPARMEYILSQTGDVAGLAILDVGCGGGLVCEPLSRLGAHVTGLDADTQAIQTARDHAAMMDLDVRYENGTVEDHKGLYDIVLVLEIIEHVDDPLGFLDDCAARLKPGGVMIVSTLNKTPQSYAFGIVAAEYILGLVPRGTHSWSKFMKPSHLARVMKQCSIVPNDMTGLCVNPLTHTYALDQSAVNINYFMSGRKAI